MAEKNNASNVGEHARLCMCLCKCAGCKALQKYCTACDCPLCETFSQMDVEADHTCIMTCKCTLCNALLLFTKDCPCVTCQVIQKLVTTYAQSQ